MLNGYAVEDGRLVPLPAPLEAPERVIWYDLFTPTREEEQAIERVVGVEVPTPDEMHEIEDSSRLYSESGAFFMTANLPSQVETEAPLLAPVTFILAGSRLVTLRYHEPRSFRTFTGRAERADLGCTDGATAMLGLLEVVVDRMADILERIGREIELLSRAIFRRSPQRTEGAGGTDYQIVLQGLGRQGDLVANVIDSLVTLERLIVFLSAVVTQKPLSKDGKLRLKSLGRDTRFLNEHANALAAKLTFLLDATLGMISIEQNAIIKIFSVAAVIFLPPTLVASIYGMNFAVMPELHWLFGYPFALGLMVASAVVSYWLFKSRGWL
ncbi:MAG: magnesium transporter CorA family protein [Amaricoccus sp.]